MAELKHELLTQTGLDLLPSTWQDKVIVVGLLKSWLEAFETPINTMFEVLNGTSFFDSEGVQLDLYGTLWDEPRNGRTDADYRVYLYATINGDVINGTLDKIKEVILSAYGSEVDIISYEHFPGNLTLYLDGNITPSLKVLGDRITAAGVSFNIRFPPYLDNKSGVKPSANAYVTEYNILNRYKIENHGVTIVPVSGTAPDGSSN